MPPNLVPPRNPGTTREYWYPVAGACRDEVLGTALEPFVQGADGLERVDLVGGLVRSQPGDARESKREPRLVAVRADDHVEGDLHDDGRLDLPVPPEALNRVSLEPRGHLRDLRIRQAAVRLADVDQPAALLVADGERVVAQHAVPLAVADLDAHDDAVDR